MEKTIRIVNQLHLSAIPTAQTENRYRPRSWEEKLTHFGCLVTHDLTGKNPNKWSIDNSSIETINLAGLDFADRFHAVRTLWLTKQGGFDDGGPQSS
jgi:hypothetical protein